MAGELYHEVARETVWALDDDNDVLIPLAQVTAPIVGTLVGAWLQGKGGAGDWPRTAMTLLL